MKSPEDIKKLSEKELRLLAKEIRNTIICTVGKNGGHLASNLGVVELTLALHRVFESPKDAIVWDVGHQCYTHKLLTGRFEKFETLRKNNGLSGFTKQIESEHDFFDSGHSSTSISAALGLLVGRNLNSQDGKVIAVIGDGALTGGMALEALSHAGQLSKNLIVVLNDNQMSISKNTGSISKYLSKLTMTSQYQTFRHKIERAINSIPLVNQGLTNFIFKIKRGIKGIFFNNNLFVDLGFEYVGPLNGHSIKEMELVFERVKKLRKPVVVHIVTQKGKGYSPAENDPTTFHGIGPFCISDGKVEKFDTLSFTEAFSDSIIKLAQKDSRIVAITAAMSKGTGLAKFAHRFPNRFFDVGIAEQHAVTFASGLAKAGLKPVVAIYSTFLQRAVDQVIHDVALQRLGVIFVLDRSGAVPDDGETHQGLFDISIFKSVPNLTLLAPASARELDLCLTWAAEQNTSVMIRYPKLSCPTEHEEFSLPITLGRGILLKNIFADNHKSDILLVTVGSIFSEVYAACRVLFLEEHFADIYNLRFIKPIDKDYFLSIAEDYSKIVFIEDGVIQGGISSYLELITLKRYPGKKTEVLGFEDKFISQGKRKDILEKTHLSAEYISSVARDL